MRNRFCYAGSGRASRDDAGISLLEVIITMSILVVVFMGLGGGVVTGTKATHDLMEDQLVKSRAQIFINRVMSLPFGKSSDPMPNATQLSALFNIDADMPAVSLFSLSKPPENDDGWMFTLNDFPVDGAWMVAVSPDLNGDGEVSGTLEERGLLLRISISFDGLQVLSTVRGRETQA